MTKLYGPKHTPSGDEVLRAGNRPGRVIFEAQRETVARPDVRQVFGASRR